MEGILIRSGEGRCLGKGWEWQEGPRWLGTTASGASLGKPVMYFRSPSFTAGPAFLPGCHPKSRDPSRTWVKGKHEARYGCSKHSLFAFMNKLLKMFHCSPTSSLRLLSLRRVSNRSPCFSGSGPHAAEASTVSADLNCLEAITSVTSVQSPILTIRVHTTACIFMPDPSLRCGDVK